MPFNGTGTFTRLYSWVTDAANGVYVDATRTDADTDGIATGLSNCVTRDGQSPPTANIPMGSYKFTGLANGASGQDSVTYAQVFVSPTFTGTPAAPTAALGTSTTQIATTAFVAGTSFASALPAQTGNSGKAVITDGTTASWGTLAALGGGTGQSSYTIGDILYASGTTALSKLAASTSGYALVSNGAGIAPSWQSVGSVVRSARTANTILAAADKGTLIDITSGTFSQTFTAAATLGSGWYCWYRNSGTGVVTLDPNSSELIDLLATRVCLPGESILIQCDAVGLNTVVINPFSITYTASDTFTMPSGYKAVGVIPTGGGGGGGSGCRRAAGGERSGGGGGGGGCRTPPVILTGLTAGTGYTVTIGAGGTAGAAISVNDTDGAAGTAGGNTSFSTFVFAYGGATSGGATSGGTATSGGGGGGSAGAGTIGGTGVGATGGLPSQVTLGGTTTPQNRGTGGGACDNSAVVGSAEYGGGAGGGCNSVSVATAGGSSVYGAPGGGGGGGIKAANTAQAGAAGGANDSFSNGGGAAGGAATGVTGTAGTPGTNGKCGSSGGGGGAAAAGAGGAGGAGAAPGGAGGGGAASVNGQVSGAGGIGARGECQVWGIA